MDEFSKFALKMGLDETQLMEVRSDRLVWQNLGKEFCRDDWRTQGPEQQDEFELSIGSSTLQKAKSKQTGYTQ